VESIEKTRAKALRARDVGSGESFGRECARRGEFNLKASERHSLEMCMDERRAKSGRLTRDFYCFDLRFFVGRTRPMVRDWAGSCR
jgi:hypothetical protein